MFEISGKYTDLLALLFEVAQDGHLQFGTARSVTPTSGFASISDWVEFHDYILEGFVTYALRAIQTAAGLRLELLLAGTNRDQYIRSSLRSYIEWAGLLPEVFPDTESR